MHIDGYQHHLKWGDTGWPDDAFVVVILFNRRCDNTAYTDTVTAHGHGELFTIFIQHLGMHGLRVFCAELEDMAHFNAAFDFQLSLAARAGIAGNDITQVSSFGLGQIAPPVDAGAVKAIFIGAADKVGQDSGAMIGNHSYGQCQRANRAGIDTEFSADALFGGKGQWTGYTG